MGGAAGGYANPFDIFESFFGGGGGGGFGGASGSARGRAPQQGNDERYDMVIEFNQAVFGCRYVYRASSSARLNIDQPEKSYDKECPV